MKTARRSLPLLLILALSACMSAPATQPVDLLGTGVAATLQALTQQAALNTPTSPPPTQTPPPPATPTVAPTVAPAIRLKFEKGATFGEVQGTLAPGQSLTYVLGAAQNQPMLVSVSSPDTGTAFSLVGRDGAALVAEAQRTSNWQGLVPTTQDYFLKITAGSAGGNFDLGVTIVSRIQFASGATSATLTGSTVGGFPVTYAARAAKGQTMNVNLSVPAGSAALTIWGFSDGNPYQRAVSESTTFNLVLPLTQDYIIEVVPVAGTVVNYSVTVGIH